MKKAILCIGIDAFDKGDITPLSGAAEDARRWAAFFEMRLGFKAELLTHEKLRKGVRILDVVDELLKHAGQPGDLFGLFIATHGKQMRLADGQMDQLFLLPHARLASIEAGSPGEGALSLRQLALETARPGLQRFFIIDACRAPLSAAGSRDAAQPFGAEGQVVYRDLLLRRAPRGQGDSPLLVLNACADQQRAAELRGRGRGVFSLAAEEVATDCFENGKRLNLDAEFVAQVGVRMRELTRDQDDLPTQDPVIDQGSPLCLWDPNDRQQQQWRNLKATFKQQLEGDALDAPAGQCARDTLAALLAAGLPATEHQTLAQRLAERLEAAQKAHTQAQQQAADARLMAAAQEFDTEAAWLAVWSGARDETLRQLARERLRGKRDGAAESLTPSAAQVILETPTVATEPEIQTQAHSQRPELPKVGHQPSVEDCDQFLGEFPDSDQAGQVRKLRARAYEYRYRNLGMTRMGTDFPRLNATLNSFIDKRISIKTDEFLIKSMIYRQAISAPEVLGYTMGFIGLSPIYIHLRGGNFDAYGLWYWLFALLFYFIVSLIYAIDSSRKASFHVNSVGLHIKKSPIIKWGDLESIDVGKTWTLKHVDGTGQISLQRAKLYLGESAENFTQATIEELNAVLLGKILYHNPTVLVRLEPTGEKSQ